MMLQIILFFTLNKYACIQFYILHLIVSPGQASCDYQRSHTKAKVVSPHPSTPKLGRTAVILSRTVEDC